MQFHSFIDEMAPPDTAQISLKTPALRCFTKSPNLNVVLLKKITKMLNFNKSLPCFISLHIFPALSSLTMCDTNHVR